MHGLHLPLTGQLLSLNQIFLLSFMSDRYKNLNHWAGGQVSLCSGLLKSFAPAGKKLTPMLAIAIQGLLFNLGFLLGGRKKIGLYLGATISALWAYIQPFILYYFIFGKDLLFMASYYASKLEQLGVMDKGQWGVLFTALILFKLILAWSVVFIASRINSSQFETYQSICEKNNILKKQNSLPHQNILVATIKDMLSPFFIFSLLLMTLFFYFTHTDKAVFIYKVLRVIMSSFLVFYFVRTKIWSTLFGWLRKRRFARDILRDFR